jgi:hypothetical protein
LFAGFGGPSGRTREGLARFSQGFESFAHALALSVVETDALALPIGLREGRGALFEVASFSLDDGLEGFAPWRLPRPLWKPSSAKESDPVREPSAPWRGNRELFRQDLEVHDVWNGFLRPGLEDRGP